MGMCWERIGTDRQRVSRWSGGETRQLAIYPETAEYGERTFKWRISTATIETNESQFTALPGYRRILMVLEGQLELAHSGHHTVKLAPFEQDAFEGSWATRSRGRAVDFNLIFSEDCRAELKTVHVSEGERIPLNGEAGRSAHGERSCRAFYCLEGILKFQIADEEIVELAAGELLLLHETGEPSTPVQVACTDNGQGRLLEAAFHFSET